MNSSYYVDTSYGYGTAGLATIGIGALLLPMIISSAISILMIISMWKIFTENGKPGWASLIPIYNIYIMCQIANKEWYYILLLCVPIANIYAMYVLYKGLADTKGKSTGFVIGMILLPAIFFPILAFSKGSEVLATPAVEPVSSVMETAPVMSTEPVIPAQPAVEPVSSVMETAPVMSTEPIIPVQSAVEPVSSVMETAPVMSTEPVIPAQPAVEPVSSVMETAPVMPTEPIIPAQPAVEPVSSVMETAPVMSTEPVMVDTTTAPSFEQEGPKTSYFVQHEEQASVVQPTAPVQNAVVNSLDQNTQQ